MVNNVSNIRGFEFHKELSISHHTQFMDKGGFLSQCLISEAVTFYCKFQASEIIVINGITKHFYIVAGYKFWSIRWRYIPYMSSTFTQGYQHRLNIFKIT